MTTFGDRYLDHLNPSPTRYQYDARTYARKLLEMVRKLEAGMDLRDLRTKVPIKPVAGESVGVPRRGPIAQLV